MNYFIYNPIAGSYSQRKRDSLIKMIKTSSENIIFESTHKNDEIRLTEKAINQGAQKIIVIGGDGTINKVASVLVNTEVSLGIIPTGSGNGLARHLGISMNPFYALERALNGTLIKIDACTINNKMFFCTAGIGFDAAVAKTFDKRGKRGFINYVIAILLTLKKYKPIEIELASGEKEELFLLTFANANQYGNNAFIAPNASVEDGKFEMIKIKINNRPMLLTIGIRLFLKIIHKSKSVETISTNNANIKYKLNHPLHLDGESAETENQYLEVGIKPRALHIIL